MNERVSRVFAALCVLAVLWIAVYWLADPGEPPISRGGAAISRAPAPVSDFTPLVRTATEPAVPPAEPERVEPEPPRAAPETRTTEGVLAPEFRSYTVRTGDTFAIIAQRELGSSSRASVIARANPFVDPTRLRAGRVLRIPVDPSNVHGLPTTQTTTRAAPEQAAEVAARGPIRYVVRPGDTLSKIASAYYGDASKASIILQANRDSIKNERSLRAGQTIVIPPKPGTR